MAYLRDFQPEDKFCGRMIQGDQSKDVDDGVVEPSSVSRGAYWFHVNVMDAGTLIHPGAGGMGFLWFH